MGFLRRALLWCACATAAWSEWLLNSIVIAWVRGRRM